MRPLIFAAVCLVCCQPIVIGTPGGGDDATDGTGSSQNGGAKTQGGRPTDDAGTGSVLVGPASAGGAAGSGGAPGNGGAALGGRAGNLNDAGSSLGGAAQAGETGSGGEAGSYVGVSGADGSPEPEDQVAPPLTARIMVVAYDPIISGLGETEESLTGSLALDTPFVLAEQLGARLRAATQGHLHFIFGGPDTRIGFPPTEDGVRYTAATYAACLANPSDCHAAADYNAIDTENEICSAVGQSPFDQVWLLGGKNFGFSNGRQLNCQTMENNGSVTKQLDVVSLDYSEGMQSLLLSYQQHSQYALMESFGVPGAIPTRDSPNNTYGLFVQAQGRASDAPASGCGDLTFAPNSLSAHRFDDPRSAPSYCETFLRAPRPAPLDALLPITCAAWGCSELGFRDFWFAHLPRAPWSDAHDKLNDFWPYILRASARLPPEPKSATCSSSYLPGWCENAIDGLSGICNEDEWALLEGQTGFVELRFVPPKLVSSVSVFDRACAEQVQAGHLEFSDGSDPIDFGELPDDGKSAVTRSFAPKLLSGLRVVIDSSAGAHPGFGDIKISSD